MLMDIFKDTKITISTWMKTTNNMIQLNPPDVFIYSHASPIYIAMSSYHLHKNQI